VARLLVASTDPALRDGLLFPPAMSGLQSHHAANAGVAMAAVVKERYHLVVLDDRLPGLTVLDAVPRLGALRTGSLVVTSDLSEITTVLLRELGADDVVGRPFSLPELRARVHAILRRRSAPPPGVRADATAGPICLHVATRLVSVRGQRLHVPQLEFAVLLALQSRDARPVSRSVLLEECWSPTAVRRPEYVDAVIRRLRLRLELQPAQPRHVLTVRGLGYALQP